MPTVRYLLRNEYGLADPQLYGAADREDPEALLEGVAVAGLVGVLRQLGDLAEFAAEIFHNLHEEVMTTAARGHALLLRVKQLEVDFPAIEREFISQTSQAQLFSGAGIKWHPNLQIDENLITREDMPRFILDSYEESRGPPRLFMLDKFDIGGDGACLKRYSDPSFFKMKFAASRKIEPDIQRERRSRKNKKKVPHGKNGETLESFYTQHMVPILENACSEKAHENPPIKRVKLKISHLNDSTNIRKSYIEHVVGMQSSDYADSLNDSLNPISQAQGYVEGIESCVLTSDIRDFFMDTSDNRSFFRERNHIRPYDDEKLIVTLKEETFDTIDRQHGKEEFFQKTTSEVETVPPFSKDQNGLFYCANNRREDNDNVDVDSRTKGSLDGYKSDDATSELDNYLDALTTVDSEIETDSETITQSITSFSKKYHRMDSNASREKKSHNEPLDSYTFTESSVQNSLFSEKELRTPNEDSPNKVNESTFHDCSRALPLVIEPEIPKDLTHDRNLEDKVSNAHLRKEPSVDSIQKQEKLEISIPFNTVQVEMSTSGITHSTSACSLSASQEEFHSNLDQNMSYDNFDTFGKNGVFFEHGQPVLGFSEAPEDSHVMMLNQIGDCSDCDKCLDDNFHQKSGATSVNLSFASEKSEDFSEALVQLRDDTSTDILVQDEPFLETSKMMVCIEEQESFLLRTSISDPCQETKESTPVFTIPISSENSSPQLSNFNQELHRSVCEGPEVVLRESLFPGNCTPVIPRDDTSTMLSSDELLGTVESTASSNENESTISLGGPKDSTDFSENKVTCMEDVGDFTATGILASGISGTEPSFDTRMSQESGNFDEADSMHEQLCNLLSYVENSSSVVYERRDSRLLTENWLDGSTAIIPYSPIEFLHPESCSSHSTIENTKADELFHGHPHPKEYFSVSVNQEEQISYNSVPDQQALEVTEALALQGSVDLDVEQIPEAIATKEGYLLASDDLDLVTAGNILDSSSGTELEDHSNVCHGETMELAEENLETAISNGAAIFSEEVEIGKLENPIPQNEPEDMDNYLGHIGASSPEHITGVHEHQASNAAFTLEDRSGAVKDPDYLKSAKAVHVSFDRMGSKPVIVHSEEEEQSVLSPPNTSSDETLPESFDAYNVGPVKQAEINVHILEVHKEIEHPVINQVPPAEPPASSEHYLAANGNVFISDNDFPTKMYPSLAVSLQSFESINISSVQKLGSLSVSGSQIKREHPHEEDNNAVETMLSSAGAGKEDTVEAVSRDKTCKLDITSAVANSDQLETDVEGPIRSSHGISVTSATSTASLVTLQSLPCFGTSSSSMIKHQSAEIPLDEDPPLPPLPPFQWRMGKLLPSSTISCGETFSIQHEMHNLSLKTSLDHPGDSLATGKNLPKPSYSLMQEQMHPNGGDQVLYLALKVQSMENSQSSTLPLAVEDEKLQDDVFVSDVQKKGLPVKFSHIVFHEEYQQKHELGKEDLIRKVPQAQILDTSTSPVDMSDMRCQQFHTIRDGESIEPPKSSSSEPTLSSARTMEYLNRCGNPETSRVHPSILLLSSETTESECNVYGVLPDRSEQHPETAVAHPSNPFLSSASTGECYSCGVLGDKTIKHLQYPDSLSMVGAISQDLLVSEGALPSAQHDRPNGKPHSLLYRPRDPLIEAVASHDKRTLRRVSELGRPSSRAKDETLLEQIRNKSFLLKPTAVMRPNIKGPPTNLKVAAILERANAIRHAFVGSDEDDDNDEDGWSDS